MFNFELPILAEIALPTQNEIFKLKIPFTSFFSPAISSTDLKFIFYLVNSPENKDPVNKPTKTAFEKYKLISLFPRLYGTLFKSLCRINQSLILRNFRSVTLNSCSRVDQARNSPSKKFHIVDMKTYKIFQERIGDGVLFLQTYCPLNCNLHSTADVPWDFLENFQNSIF